MTMCHRQPPNVSVATSSQQMALNANKNKNWRANYLRKLNIFAPDVACSQCGSSEDGGQRATANGRSVTDEATHGLETRNKDRERSVVSVPSSTWHSSRPGPSCTSKRNTMAPEDKTSSCVFGLRSHRLRPRSLAPKSEHKTGDRMSAPIKIPTKSPTTILSHGDKLLARDAKSRRSVHFQEANNPTQPLMQLFSWEEPSVMLGNGCWPLECDKRNCNKLAGIKRNDGRRWMSRLFSKSESVAESCEDAELEGLTNVEDDDDIFKMEVDEGSNLTPSRNVIKEKRPPKIKRRVDSRQRRLGTSNEFEEDAAVAPLSASFVPPHQMVERGCFSLGLRAQLKRKPGVHN